MTSIPFEFDLEEYGHVGVFGSTGSGKTTYIKYMLDNLNSERDSTHVYSTTGYQWKDVTDLVYESFDNIGDVVSSSNKKFKDSGTKTFIIFDDFNEVINTQTDKRYIALFTHGRHAGIVVINGGHTPTSMGAKARKNLKYSVIMNTSDMETLSSLSQYYLLGNTDKLIRAMDDKPDKFTAVVIENETRSIKYDKAGSFSNSNNRGGGVNNEIGNKSFNDCNVMDQSSTNYNINQNIEIKNMIEANDIKNQLSMVNYKHRLEMKKMESQEELKNLILKFAKTRQDQSRMVSLLNVFITNYDVTISNAHKYITPFMSHYYPTERYAFNDDFTTRLVDENLSDLYQGNFQNMMIGNAVRYGMKPASRVMNGLVKTLRLN
jgi:hypothetical protein